MKGSTRNFGSLTVALLLLIAFGVVVMTPSRQKSEFQLAAFAADVTPPLGHVLFTGGFQKAEAVDSRLEARGLVLLPPADRDEKPIVICVLDWAEIRNEAWDRWRDALAEAASTDRERVLVSCIHQHDAPLADLEAQRILDAAGSPHQVIDLAFHERAVSSVAEALRDSLMDAVPVTHLGLGKGRVDRIASNRRYELPDGSVSYNRMSSCRNLSAQQAPEGEIDPFVHALSFWHGDRAVAVLSVYASHPMSYYRTGEISADFPGLARAARQKETPETFQIYASGCSGNVTAGKYNEGNPENRPVLAERLRAGMASAFESTRKAPLRSLEHRLFRLRLEPRDSPGFREEDLKRQIEESTDARSHGMAALGLSWLRRAKVPSHRIDLPGVRFNGGEASLLLLPGEIYVEYQLAAQQMDPDSFIVTIGYGECAPGYLPTARAWQENDSNLKGWCWVNPGMEPRIREALQELLRPDP